MTLGVLSFSRICNNYFCAIFSSNLKMLLLIRWNFELESTTLYQHKMYTFNTLVWSWWTNDIGNKSIRERKGRREEMGGVKDREKDCMGTKMWQANCEWKFVFKHRNALRCNANIFVRLQLGIFIIFIVSAWYFNEPKERNKTLYASTEWQRHIRKMNRKLFEFRKIVLWYPSLSFSLFCFSLSCGTFLRSVRCYSFSSNVKLDAWDVFVVALFSSQLLRIYASWVRLMKLHWQGCWTQNTRKY